MKKIIITILTCLLVGCGSIEPTTRQYEQSVVITTYGPRNEQLGQYRVDRYTVQDMPARIWFVTPEGFRESGNFRIDLVD